VHDEAQTPFGGKAGTAEPTDLRWITVQAGPRHDPL